MFTSVHGHSVSTYGMWSLILPPWTRRLARTVTNTYPTDCDVRAPFLLKPLFSIAVFRESFVFYEIRCIATVQLAEQKAGRSPDSRQRLTNETVLSCKNLMYFF